MKLDYVNLYSHFSLAAPENAAGNLQVFLPHIPDNYPRRRPAVLVLPGGGYYHVSQRESEPIALQFLAQGYCAFILEYSCAPHRFPVALQEAAMAMAYIRENADVFQVDPQMIAAVGFSAGGHLCGCLGTMYDCPEVAQLALPYPVRPDALGLCYPVVISWGNAHQGSFQVLAKDDQALKDRLSLDRLVRPDMPPVYLWHTETDTIVPVQNATALAEALKKAGVPLAMRIYPEGPHGLSLANQQVYYTGKLPAFTPEIPNWPLEMQDFFRAQGFRLYDVPITN